MLQHDVINTAALFKASFNKRHKRQLLKNIPALKKLPLVIIGSKKKNWMTYIKNIHRLL